jgi:hypothetical protein
MASIRFWQFETFWGRICFFLVPIPPRVDLGRSKMCCVVPSELRAPMN